MFEHIPLGAICLLAAIIVVNSLLIIFLKVKQNESSSLRRLLMNLSLFTISTCAVLLILELYFAFFYIESDGFAYTLSNKKWLKKYYSHTNEFGYRDRSYSKEDFAGKNIIYIVGDSIVQGAGIKDVSDRFSNILQDNLGPENVVVNMGSGGNNTRGEFEGLLAFSEHYSIIPDTIILAYYINDIQGTNQLYGYYPFAPRPSEKLLFLSRNSSLFDYVYWRLYMIFKNYDIYWDYIKKSYNDTVIWETHKIELQQFIDISRNNNIRLIVIIFPQMTNIEYSMPITEKVFSLFQQNDVESVDLSHKFKTWNENDLIVSKVDSHPNETAHREVSSLLTALILNSSSGSGF
jgi:lysophospholipase L1-like esterase